IPKEQLTIIFIGAYYDLPIQGLAIYRAGHTEQIIRFDCSSTVGDKQAIYRIEQLSPEELAYEIAEKEKFERCVGCHWSFDPTTGEQLQKNFSDIKPEITKAYYEKKQTTPEFPDPILLGWTDQIR
ncbi:MAG: hypothetical protein ACRCWR_02825, partial [Saezia sp.]